MGWRISLYRLPKQTADKWKSITEEQYHTDEENLYDELTSECIFYDTLTDIICEDRDMKLHSDFFVNDINTNESAYITISKEQFLSIIEEVRQRIIRWLDGRKVINLHSKWKVSGGGSYEYLIFNLIHIYKIFDWENDVLLAIGCQDIK